MIFFPSQLIARCFELNFLGSTRFIAKCTNFHLNIFSIWAYHSLYEHWAYEHWAYMLIAWKKFISSAGVVERHLEASLRILRISSLPKWIWIFIEFNLYFHTFLSINQTNNSLISSFFWFHVTPFVFFLIILFFQDLGTGREKKWCYTFT